MLCLERKPGESIKIGPDIEVKVLRVQGKCVMLGIAAPFKLTIVRVGETDELSLQGGGKTGKVKA